MHAVRNLTRAAFGTARDPLVAARLRADVVDVARAGDAAQPVGVQGRHGERQGRGDRRARAARLGPAGRRPGAGRVARRRHVHRRRAGSGCSIETWDRTSLREQEAIVGRTKGEGAPLSGGTEFTEPDFAPARAATGEPLIADGLARPARPPVDRTAGRGCCAAATTSRTATTRSAGSTRGCSSSPSCATRGRASSRSSRRWPRHDVLNEYLTHTGSGAVRGPARRAGDQRGRVARGRQVPRRGAVRVGRDPSTFCIAASPVARRLP